MAATGNMAVIAALMAGFSFAGLTEEIPDAASKSKTAGHFLMGTSVTTGLSLLLLFQQSIEYNFCMRELSSYGTAAAFKIVQAMRWQRRVGEMCFIFAIPAFLYSAGSMAILKTIGTGYEQVGHGCNYFLGCTCVLILVVLVSMEKIKLQQHKTAAHKPKVKSPDSTAGSTQFGNSVRSDPIPAPELQSVLEAGEGDSTPPPQLQHSRSTEERLRTLISLLAEDLITQDEYHTQRKAVIAGV